jgi:hypothetical protein
MHPYDGDTSDDRYFYLHGRLRSVRLIIADNGSVVKHRTYDPFGEKIELSDGPQMTSDGFMFIGQYSDSKIVE